MTPQPPRADAGHDARHAEALLQTGALQSAIFNSAIFSSIATDAKGVMQIFNVGAQRMLGYVAADVVNKITPADISDPPEVIARARALSVELGTPITPGFEALVFKASRGIEDIYELTYFRKDGSRFPAVVSVTALRDAQDGIIGYLLIGTDNTARQRTDEERTRLDQRVRDQHFYTRSLIESNIDALMATDPRGIITDVNKQTEALTGCTRDELIGAPFKNYFTDAGRAEAGINRVLAEGKVTNYELTARARDGTLTVVSYNATTFHDRDRRLQGVIAAARDMTELKHFEQTLQQKNMELEHASRMKSEFLANMSHELRTPLNAIIGFSEVLKDGLVGGMTPQQRGFIVDIFTSGKHLLSLINDILDLSKVEAGKMLLDLEPADVSSLLHNSLSIIREKAAARQVQLRMDGGEHLGEVQADARKLKQIVYNLLSNAVKFTNEGGIVTLGAALVPRAAVGQLSGVWPGRTFPLVASGYGEFLQLSVRTGCGRAPSTRKTCRRCTGVIRRCLLPNLDVLLPAVRDADGSARFFVVVFANDHGTATLARRIHLQLERHHREQPGGPATAVSFRLLPAVTPDENHDTEAMVAAMATAIENGIRQGAAQDTRIDGSVPLKG